MPGFISISKLLLNLCRVGRERYQGSIIYWASQPWFCSLQSPRNKNQAYIYYLQSKYSMRSYLKNQSFRGSFHCYYKILIDAGFQRGKAKSFYNSIWKKPRSPKKWTWTHFLIFEVCLLLFLFLIQIYPQGVAIWFLTLEWVYLIRASLERGKLIDKRKFCEWWDGWSLKKGHKKVKMRCRKRMYIPTFTVWFTRQPIRLTAQDFPWHILQLQSHFFMNVPFSTLSAQKSDWKQ